MNNLSKEKYLYRLKDPQTGQYLQKLNLHFSVDGNSEECCDISTHYYEYKIYQDVQSLAEEYIKVDRAKKYLKLMTNLRHKDHELNDALVNYGNRREKEIGSIVVAFDRLVIEILKIELTDIKLDTTIDKLKIIRLENLLENQFSELISGSKDIAKLRPKEMYRVYKIWESIPKKNNWDYLMYGSMPDKNYPAKVGRIDRLEELLDSAGVDHYSFKEHKHPGFAAVKEKDMNLLRISYTDAINSYIKISEIENLKALLKNQLESSSK